MRYLVVVVELCGLNNQFTYVFICLCDFNIFFTSSVSLGSADVIWLLFLLTGVAHCCDIHLYSHFIPMYSVSFLSISWYYFFSFLPAFFSLHFSERTHFFEFDQTDLFNFFLLLYLVLWNTRVTQKNETTTIQEVNIYLWSMSRAIDLVKDKGNRHIRHATGATFCC